MNSLTLECKTCSNYIAVENAGADSAIETTACGICGVAPCGACETIACAECGDVVMCADCGYQGNGECVDCVTARVAELESADVPCTCGNGDYADVRGCESCDADSPYRRALADAEAIAAAIALRVPECEHASVVTEEFHDVDDERVWRFQVVTCCDCGVDLAARRGRSAGRAWSPRLPRLRARLVAA